MPNVDIPGGRVVYDRGLSGIYIDDAGKQYAIPAPAVRVFTIQAAEIERLKKVIVNAKKSVAVHKDDTVWLKGWGNQTLMDYLDEAISGDEE